MKSKGSPLWLMVWAALITAVTIFGVTYGPPSPDHPPTFSQAAWSSGGSSEVRSLPNRPKRSESSATSSFHFEWTNTDELSEPVLYAPTLLLLHEVRINDQPQTDSVRYTYLAGDTYTSRPFLVRLPVDRTSTSIDITLEGSDMMKGYLSELWVGEREDLEPYYNQQHMTTIGFRKFMSYWLLLLSIVMALLWILRRQEVSYGLFAVIAAWQVINNLPIIIDNSLLTIEWFRTAYLSGLWKAVILVPFAYSFTKTHTPIPVWFFFALCLIASLTCALLPNDQFLSIAKYLLIPIACVHLVWSIALITRAAWRGQFQSTLVLITLLMGTAFAVHDFMIIFGLLQSRSNFLLVYAFLPMLSTICIILVFQFVQSQAQIDNMHSTLKKRLDHREKQLQAAFDREQKVQHQRTITDERQRIIADMHDGLGGQLMSIVASANSSAADNKAISHHARQALTDLRLMILSLDNAYQDLVGLLAAFRDRAQNQCESFEVDFAWEAQALPEIETLSPETSANLLRIMQEALQNALRHSGASKITLRATGDHEGGLIISLKDNGQGGANPRDTGRGMHTMHRRALSIDASLVINSDEHGTEVSLSVPRGSLTGSVKR